MNQLAAFAAMGFVCVATPFAEAAETPATAKRTDNRPLLSVPIGLFDDTPYLQVRVNDSAPLTFIVDSGASACVLDKQQCQTLGIRLTGKRQGTGAGAGTYDLFYIEKVRFAFASLTFVPEKSYAIDLSKVDGPNGKPPAGILGYDFFERYIVAIDYPRSSLTIYDPKTFSYRGTGEILPLVFKKKVPWVKGTIRVPGHAPVGGREWLVDSGSSDTLNDDLLAQSTGPKSTTTGGVGLGRKFEILRATAEEVQLGKLRFPNVTGFSGAMKIGGGLLRQFRVIFDYPGKRMILERGG
jgi:hypothetical protein